MARVYVRMFLLYMLYWYMFFFFFSSRRRHTRSDRDWSSDVCSSDLEWPSLPGGVVVEKEGHSGRLAIQLSNNCSELWMGGETIPDQVVFCSSNRTGFSLILSQLADER